MEPVSVKPETESKKPDPKLPDPADLEQETGKKQPGKGRVGSLENPEVYEDVPGHVLPILEREFDDFDNEAGKFLAGKIEEEKFIGFRLKQGVYGQRQPDVQMIRVKLPFGGVTPEQMEAFAELAETYTPLRKGHITTRQNFQFHHIPLDDAAKAIRMLGDAGLSIGRFTATPAPLYQILPASWHKRWVAATQVINAAIARKVRRLLGYQFIVLAHPKEAGERPETR